MSLLEAHPIRLVAAPPLAGRIEELRAAAGPGILFENDSHLPRLTVEPAGAAVPATALRGLAEAHARLGDFGVTRPSALFQAFFPLARLEIRSRNPGVERCWNPSRPEWIALLRDGFEEHFSLPKAIQIELTNLCNLACPMCHAHDPSGNHKPLSRRQEFMEFDLFRRIIDDAVAPDDARRRVESVTLQAWGESMLHPRLLEAVSYARDKGIGQIGLITNGTLAGKACSVRDLAEAGLTRLQVSLDAVTMKTYRAVRIRELFREAEMTAQEAARIALRNRLRHAWARATGGTPPRPFALTVSFAHQPANDAELEAFVRRWAPRTLAVQVAPLYERFDYRNVYFAPGIPRNPCIALWRNMLVTADGTVTVCCADYDARHPVGRISDRTSLRDVWTSDSYESFRRDHLEGEGTGIEMCAACIGSGSIDRRPGRFFGFPAVYYPHIALVYRRDTWVVKFLRRLLGSAPAPGGGFEEIR